MQHRKPRYEIPEAAKLLGISRAWAYRRIAAGALRVTKDGRRTFIVAEEIDRYVAGSDTSASVWPTSAGADSSRLAGPT